MNIDMNISMFSRVVTNIKYLHSIFNLMYITRLTTRSCCCTYSAPLSLLNKNVYINNTVY